MTTIVRVLTVILALGGAFIVCAFVGEVRQEPSNQFLGDGGPGEPVSVRAIDAGDLPSPPWRCLGADEALEGDYVCRKKPPLVASWVSCNASQFLTYDGGCAWPDLTEFVPDLPPLMIEEDRTPKCDPETFGGMNVNGTPYRCNPETKHVEVNEAEIAREQRREANKRDLVFALQSRVLTDAEMSEVAAMGTNLFIHEMVPYNEADVQKQFNEALLQQARLRGLKPTKPHS